MIDLLNKIATYLQFLRIPFIVLGLISLAAMITIIIGSKSYEDDFFLIPSAVGVLWSITSYSFLINFSSVPKRADPSWKFFRRLKHHVSRAGYWLLGNVFFATTLGALFASYRMFSIWLRDYAG
jgi:hypothetical protein